MAGRARASLKVRAGRRLLAVGLAVLVASSPFTPAPNAVRAAVVGFWMQAGTPLTAPNGEIRQLASIGSMYAVGSFTSPASRVAFNTDPAGTGAWAPLAGGGLDGTGNTLAWASQFTRLVVGGTFATAGGVAAANIAQWNPTGSWSAMGPGFNGGVLAVTNFNSQVIAAGSFTEDGTNVTERRRIASWNGTAWSNLGSGVGLDATSQFSVVNDRVHAMAVYQGKLVVAGHFTTAGGNVPVNNIAQWDGSNWTQLGGLTTESTRFTSGVNNTVLALAVDGNTLYATGEFTRAGDIQSVSHIAKWTGSAWQPLAGTAAANQGSGLDDWGNSLAVSGTKLIVGGDFLAVGNDLTPGQTGLIPARRMAAFDTATSTWTAMGDGFNAPVRTVAVHGGNVYAAGNYDHTTGGPVRVARYTGTYLTTGETTWNPPPSAERVLPAVPALSGYSFPPPTPGHSPAGYQMSWDGPQNQRAQWTKIWAQSPNEWNKPNGFNEHAKGEAPDTTYYWWKSDKPLPAGTIVHLEGDFPYSRFFSIGATSPSDDKAYCVSGDGSCAPEISYRDDEIEPDAGNFNPFQVGVSRKATPRHYKVSFTVDDSAAPVDSGITESANNHSLKMADHLNNANSLYVSPDSRGATSTSQQYGPAVWVEIGLPDGFDPLGGVEPPILSLEFPTLPGTKYLAPVSRGQELHVGKLIPPYAQNGLANGNRVRGTDASDPLSNRSFKEAQAQDTLARRVHDALDPLTPGNGLFQNDPGVHAIFDDPLEPGRLKLFKIWQAAYYVTFFSYWNNPTGCTSTLPYVYGGAYPGMSPASASFPQNSQNTSGHNAYTAYLGGSANLADSTQVVEITGTAPTSPQTLQGDPADAAETQTRYWHILMQTGDPIALSAIVAISDEEIIRNAAGQYKIIVSPTRPANATPENGITWVKWPLGKTMTIIAQVVTTPVPAGAPEWANDPRAVPWSDVDYCAAGAGVPAAQGGKSFQSLRDKMGPYYFDMRYKNNTTDITPLLGAPYTTPKILLDGDIPPVIPPATTVGNSSYSAANRLWTISGKGVFKDGAGSTSDEGFLSASELVGNGSIVVHLGNEAEISGGPNNAAGLMMRESTAAGARHMFIGWRNGSCRQVYRKATGGTNTRSVAIGECAGTGSAAPGYVKIERSFNNKFKTYTSPDGIAWTQQGAAVTLTAGTYHVGMFVASGNSTPVSVGGFSNFART